MRHKTPLNFDWDFCLTDLNIESMDSMTFTKVNLPHNLYDFPLHYFNEKEWPKKAWYRFTIERPLLDSNLRNQVIFEGVMVQADYYLNRHWVAHSDSPYLPFVLDVTKDFIQNDKLEILVHVDAQEDPNIPPFGHVVDYLTYGGIYREVYLLKTPMNALNRLKINTHDSSKVQIKVETVHPLDKSFNLKLELLDENNVFYTDTTNDFEQNTLSLEHEPKERWSLDHPKLYRLVVSLYQDDTLIDQMEERYGYRSAQFKADGFYLNGQRIQLMGLNRHQSYPYVGYAMPKSAQILDADILKNELGLNLVRTSHYPQSKHFLDRCDELGLLVFEELPGWQHIGNEAWKDRSLRSIEDMIHRDYNHPSIVLWGVRINESKDDHDFYTQTNALAHQLDPFRQTGGVRNFAHSQLLEDVYTYNDFNFMGDNRPLSRKSKIVKGKVPYLVTEYLGHMFPTKKTDSEDRRIEHTKRHLDVLNQAQADPNISGTIGWCMADYNTHADFGSGDRICYHGVMDIFRLPKLASSAYASQGLNTPYCVWGSQMEIGDRDASLLNPIPIYTNCDYIDLYKGKQFIKRFYPDHKSYPHLKHPPIFIDDLIGQQIVDSQRFSLKDARKITRIFNRINTVGYAKLTLLQQLSVALILLKNRMSFSYASDLYTEFVGNWGQSTKAYHLKAYQNDHCVIESSVGASTEFSLKLDLQDHQLIEDETYDVLRCVISLRNQYDRILNYAEAPIHIKLMGPIELIGPATLSLKGGSAAFWVKSQQQTGLASIQVTHPQLGTVEESIHVIKSFH